MGTMSGRAGVVIAGLLTVVACSDDSSSASPIGGGLPLVDDAGLQTFSAYCTGTLNSQRVVMEQAGPLAWSSSSKRRIYAPAGSTFLLSESFSTVEGYVFLDNGKPGKLDADFKDGLIKGADFSSDCAKGTSVKVLLTSASVYPNQDGSGQVCSLPAGTVMNGYGHIFMDGWIKVHSAEIKATCGLDEGYSQDLVAVAMSKR